MKYLYCLLLVICFFNIANTQNRVLNPSFEDTVECSYTPDEVYNAIGWNSLSSANYFFDCEYFDGIPNNLGGFQLPATGNTYCGFYSFSEYVKDIREILEGQLIENLIIGQKYFISFKINFGNNSNCSTNKIGIKFSTYKFNYNHDVIDPNIINNFAHFYIDSVINDTLNWGLLKGSFIADSAYKYISIGNFFDDNNTIINLLNGATECFPYYFIDDICVSPDSITCNNIIGINNKKLNDYHNIFYSSLTNEIIIETKNNIENIEIYDIKGIKVLFNKIKYNSNSFQLKLNDNFNSGIYVIKIIDNKTVTNKKILIIK